CSIRAFATDDRLLGALPPPAAAEPVRNAVRAGPVVVECGGDRGSAHFVTCDEARSDGAEPRQRLRAAIRDAPARNRRARPPHPHAVAMWRPRLSRRPI